MKFQFLRLGCPRKGIIVSKPIYFERRPASNTEFSESCIKVRENDLPFLVQIISECTLLKSNLFGYRQKTNLAPCPSN